jgi:hypothetical protein
MSSKKASSSIAWLVFYLYCVLCIYLLVEKATETPALQKKIDVSTFHGLSLWLTTIYNDERMLFAIIVTLTMAFIGITLAFITDILLKFLGLEVTKIKHLE